MVSANGYVNLSEFWRRLDNRGDKRMRGSRFKVPRIDEDRPIAPFVACLEQKGFSRAEWKSREM
jgi:hypothetical protein